MSYANKEIIDELIAVEKKMDAAELNSIIIIANNDGSGGHIHVEGSLNLLVQMTAYFMTNCSEFNEVVAESIKHIKK